MMRISINENSVNAYLDDPKELSPSQVNQLKMVFKFKLLSPTQFQLALTANPFVIIQKVLSYFDRQSISYALCPLLSEIKAQSQQHSQRFEQLKKQAFHFKNGETNQPGLAEFYSFVEKHIKRRLKDHQIKSAYHHYVLKNAANFSVPGSGKTTTILAVFEKMRHDEEVDTLFVVGPLSCFRAWKAEYTKVLGKTPDVRVLSGLSAQQRSQEYYDESSNPDLVLISFPTVANDYKQIKKFFARKKIFLVVDEAHYIKQIDGKWSSAIIDASGNAKAKFILTGTPCPKSYSDLFNLFDLLWGQNMALSEQDKLLIVEYQKNNDWNNAQRIIREKLDPLFYRVRKRDLKLTEQNILPVIIIEMNEIERKIYDSIFKRISELSEFDGEKNITAILSLKRGRIIRLRQMLSYSKLLSTAIDGYEEVLFEDKTDLKNLIINYDKFETPAKLTRLIELIKEIKLIDKKVVVWTNFKETIRMLKRELQKNGFKCDYIDGTTPTVEKDNNFTRDKIIEEFLNLDGNIDILIANPAACAESISLHTSCHHAVYYDLSYNCAQYLQSLDRIHRVGGSEDKIANYYFLQYQNTIDNDILNNLLAKRDRMYAVIEYDSDIYELDIGVFVDGEGDESAYDRIFTK